MYLFKNIRITNHEQQVKVRLNRSSTLCEHNFVLGVYIRRI